VLFAVREAGFGLTFRSLLRSDGSVLKGSSGLEILTVSWAPKGTVKFGSARSRRTRDGLPL
jgi:hypothetical protein